MADSPRIEELRRRLQKDPASIAFAQLAEEYRRAGRYRDAIDTCRAGLAIHPGYLSARVTLGRSLIEMNELDRAQTELSEVLRLAPENLAAIRGLAEVHRRRGELPEALEQYRAAFELARNDPGIDQIVKEIRREIDPRGQAAPPRPSVTPRPGAGASANRPSPTARPALGIGRPDVPPSGLRQSSSRLEAERTVQALERWLDAIVIDRQRRHAEL